MGNQLSKYVLAGVLGTIVMTIVMIMAPNLGMPEMAPWKLLSGAMGVPIIIGWIMHFIIGILFALGYGYVFAPNVSIKNIWLKGIAFGIVALILAQIGMQVMGIMFEMPPMDGSMPMRLVAMLIGHLVFGVVTVKSIGK
ncbi:hypothetical protein LCGC14_0129240 [marine sediment metagenome]|uniref:Uncharacterized protein n=1 Tax=marine sediment metagenome TaxID=412755 RepID=A0A0F9VJY4_9ZZZZ|nr:DUF6789 family protein [Maribacter sp.]HDZ06108.1 hypothetical protein [Maribacter sp.]HEA80820.1 hypothetical protein [Maribacter sp.]